jgi:hypothetical protein
LLFQFKKQEGKPGLADFYSKGNNSEERLHRQPFFCSSVKTYAKRGSVILHNTFKPGQPNGAEVLSMSTNDELTVPQDQLVQAWKQVLPEWVHGGDRAEVWADEADPQALRVHIRTAGHQMMEFDFAVRYVDSREIDIRLADTERDGQTVDERNDVMQALIRDYRRHLHECAQALQDVTHT